MIKTGIIILLKFERLTNSNLFNSIYILPEFIWRWTILFMANINFNYG